MIASLRGKVLEKQPTRLVLETGGVGFEVLAPLTATAAAETGRELFLYTVLVVREDALTLYGFLRTEERALFRKLLTVSGIGPRTALSALSGATLEELVTALRQQDLAVLTRIPGIGKKTAERMAVELKDALPEFEVTVGEPADQAAVDAVAALISLGYAPAAARGAVDTAVKAAGPGDAEAIIRRALGSLAPGSRR